LLRVVEELAHDTDDDVSVRQHEAQITESREKLELLSENKEREFLLRHIFGSVVVNMDCLCGLVVTVTGCRCRGPGSIPGATRFFLRSSGSGTGSTQPRDEN
jgi:hypothetical protein